MGPSDFLGRLLPRPGRGDLILLSRRLGRYRPLTVAAMITVLGAVRWVPLGVIQW